MIKILNIPITLSNSATERLTFSLILQGKFTSTVTNETIGFSSQVYSVLTIWQSAGLNFFVIY